MSPDATAEPGWVDDVLGFWFGLPPEAWFEKSDALDRECATRFRDVHAALMASAAAEQVTSARRALAAAIVLDQFSRNIYRGTPGAFASDPLAKEIASRAIGLGYDAALSKHERMFLYLPFEHSESLDDQERSVALFKQLDDDFYFGFAVAHRDIIVRFRRFPHRNALLDRPSTPEEIAFLAEPGSSF
jgi:uncharacterized protein (DUF924 family)